MAEWLIVATFITGAILAIRSVGGRALTMAVEPPVSDENTEDLPCPWCHTATSANDARCPGCGRRFG